MCWNRSGSPPSAGSKMPTPHARSTVISSSVTATTGVASNWIRLVAYSDQTNSGMRPHVMPGQRILWIVTMMFSPVMIELNPEMNTPSTPVSRSTDWPACCTAGRASSRYRCRRPAPTTRPARAPIMNTYQLARLSLGNARSLVPIIIGMKKFPNTAGTAGIRKKNSIITPWAVNDRL